MDIFIETGCSSLAVIKMWSFHGWIAPKCSQFTKTSMNTIHSIVWKNHHYFSFIRLPNFGQWTILLWIFFGVIYLHRCFVISIITTYFWQGQMLMDKKNWLQTIDKSSRSWRQMWMTKQNVPWTEDIIYRINPPSVQ